MDEDTQDPGETPVEAAQVLGGSAVAEPAVDVVPDQPEGEPATSDQVRADEPEAAPRLLYRDTERDLEIREGDHVIVSKDGRRDGAIVRGAEEDGLVLERKDEKATRMVVLPSAIEKVVAR